MKNLKSLAIEPTGKMEVKDPAGNFVYQDDGKTPCTITVHSPGTKIFQQALHSFNDKKSGGLSAIINGKDAKKSADADAKDLAVFLAAVTISFDGFDYEGRIGNAAYRAAYEDIEIGHVATDLNKFLGDRGNFWKAPAPTSNSMSDSQPG